MLLLSLMLLIAVVVVIYCKSCFHTVWFMVDIVVKS